MRVIACATFLLVAAASGCGTWSNDDLVFLYALPSKDKLQANVPGTGTTQQGLGTRRDGLSLNGPSGTFERTKKAATEFNGGLLKLLGLVDTVRKLKPSHRTEDSRTWGPYSDASMGDREARLVITRKEDASGLRFEWSIDVKKKADGESAWFSAITGYYLPNSADDVRKGEGVVNLDAAGTRDRGLAAADDDGRLQTMEIRYATDADPVHVEIDFAFKAISWPDIESWSIHYESDQAQDGSGALKFQVYGDLYKTLSSNKETLTYLSRWTAGNAGRADITGTGGDFGTAVLQAGTDCWDASFNSVYVFEAKDIDVDGNGLTGEAQTPQGDSALCAFSAP